jgi:biopolymer transport protein ExbB/biopolymer transport protein TolQ
MLIERLLKIALLGSSWVLYVLIFLSVLSLTTAFERWLYFRKHRDDVPELRKKLVQRLDAGDISGTVALVKANRSFEAHLALTALNWAHVGPDAINDAVEAELALVRKELEKGSNFLGTVGNNAPFVGLLGTVLGVIISFQALGSNGQNAGAMGEVMAGIAEALVATGVGLFVALPAVVAYNVLQKRIGDLESDVIAFTKLIAAYARSNADAFTQHQTRVSSVTNDATQTSTDSTVQVAAVA